MKTKHTPAQKQAVQEERCRRISWKELAALQPDCYELWALHAYLGFLRRKPAEEWMVEFRQRPDEES